jgi:acyl CoA:acetate/3-ketoacid CoA transferase alpha subunit
MTRWIALAEAAALVTDGCALALGGMTIYRRPVAFVRALLERQQRPRDLTLIAFTAGYESDLLVGAGLVARVRTCYFGLEAFGLAPMFTERANAGALEILEETEASLALGLRAAASGISFLPGKAWIGTDLFRLRPDVLPMTDPYTGEALAAFPAIVPDIAVLHALEADPFGSVRLNHNLGVDIELCSAARTVIVTAERIVERVALDETGMVIPPVGVDYIALAPRGAFPTSCHPHYPVGGGELMRYVDACNAGEFDAYLRDVLRDAAG